MVSDLKNRVSYDNTIFTDIHFFDAFSASHFSIPLSIPFVSGGSFFNLEGRFQKQTALVDPINCNNGLSNFFSIFILSVLLNTAGGFVSKKDSIIQGSSQEYFRDLFCTNGFSVERSADIRKSFFSRVNAWNGGFGKGLLQRSIIDF